MSKRLLILTLAAGLLVASPATTAPPASAARHAEIHLLIAELHQAKKLLDTAIHDYDGHRAKAAHLVHSAIKELEEHHKAHATQPGAPAAPAAKAANPAAPAAPKAEVTAADQAASDAQLKQAATLIQNVHSILANSSQSHHVNAATHLREAHGELKVALSIK
jgi:hypothetical protein